MSSPQQDVVYPLCCPRCLRQLATKPSLTVCLHQPMVNRSKLPTLSRVPDHAEPVVIYEHNANYDIPQTQGLSHNWSYHSCALKHECDSTDELLGRDTDPRENEHPSVRLLHRRSGLLKGTCVSLLNLRHKP